MKTDLKATLEAAMKKWLEKTCEHVGRPEGYVYTELNEAMANAAASVYDASFAAQEFAEMERGDAP